MYTKGVRSVLENCKTVKNCFKADFKPLFSLKDLGRLLKYKTTHPSLKMQTRL